MAEDAVFLDHAGGAPISSRVDEAVRKASDDAAHHIGAERAERLARAAARVRERVAALIGAKADEIAFAPHANAALAQVELERDTLRSAMVGRHGARSRSQSLLELASAGGMISLAVSALGC